MKILCTMPGKLGDALWALPTVRMISRHYGTPVDFAMCGEHGDEGLLRLIRAQDYIADAFALDTWTVEYKEYMSPREAPLTAEQREQYDRVFDLGYAGWPDRELAQYIYTLLKKNYAMTFSAGIDSVLPETLDMSPWISVKDFGGSSLPSVFIGWNQEWIELKMGIVCALTSVVYEPVYYLGYKKGMRHEEFPVQDVFPIVGDLYEAAECLASADFYLGCLSAQWVLANAMGKRCLVVEPAQGRLNPIFWRESPLNTMVLGGDGKPTFDARHVVDAVKEELKRSGF